MVEAALVMPIFAALLLGSVEAGYYYFVSESVRYYVGELARAVILDPSADWNSGARTLVSRAPVLRAENFTTLNVNVARVPAPALTTVTVTANYRHTMKIFSGWPTSINSGVTLRFIAS